MTKHIACLFLILTSLHLAGKAQPETADRAFYWVTFTDKADSPFSVDQPEAFLSKRALARRERHGIAVTETDLPVTPRYLDSLRLRGAVIHHTSRWFNAATILTVPDSLSRLESLSFVDTVTYVGRFIPKRKKSRGTTAIEITRPLDTLPDLPYGYATQQIAVLNGDSLHRTGHDGKGIRIGVLDGGFYNVNILPFFDSLRRRGGLLVSRDFVEGDTMAFESSTHGTQVLSVMAGNLPFLLVGTAPGADYLCLRTEDVRGEYRLEECNWIAGAEYADSAGVDLINASLGYFTFNDSTMNYTYDDLDGRTSLSSRAADLAFERGMIVVTSAGNEGNSAWQYISVPADARGALAIAATNSQGRRASFSSIGPAADGRIKPDLAAPGAFVAVASPDSYQVMVGSGTSFAAPVISGLIASLWQAFPEARNIEILEAVKLSAHQYNIPDPELGYGIPDFMKAYRLLAEKFR